MYNKLINGLDETENIVALEVKNDQVYAYFNNGDLKKRPAIYFICATYKIDKHFTQLEGNNEFKYVRTFKDKETYKEVKKKYWRYKDNIWSLSDDVEAHMLTRGTTLFKGLKVDQVSRLGFDIESDGLIHTKDSTVFTIANTFRDGKGNESKKVFRVDDYNSCGEMITDWCKYVREIDPTILVAHNGIGYDLPYLKHVAKLNKVKLELGRDGSEVKFASRPRNYRVDGSQTWEYNNVNIFGRHMIDTMFLSVKYDIGRQFPSWGLKPIIEHLGLVEEGRQFYDASKIKDNWDNLEEREKIVKYCEDDGDDCLNLYELMIPSFFYMTQSIPKSFQSIINGASGSWLNSIMVRAYLQDFKSIPKASEKQYVHGGISFGIAGNHRNVVKIDFSGLYPSIIRSYGLYSKTKDPDAVYLEMTNIFTEKRLYHKELYKKNKNSYDNDMQASYKVFANSIYGLVGTPNLHFNDFDVANKITRIGRQNLRKCMVWASGKDIEYWMPEYELEKDNE